MNMMGGGGRQPACYWTGLTLTNFPKRPRSRNSITPVILANSVSSLPSPTFSPGLMRVPRWRTIIDPPETNWPPKAFTPSRCELESRPFFELPKPFLCAMTQLLADNIADGDAREILAMADGPLVLLLALELENQRLFAASMRGDGAADARVSGLHAGPHRIAVDNRQHAAELDLRADVSGERFHFHRVTRSDAILLSTRFDDCVHSLNPSNLDFLGRSAPSVITPRKHPGNYRIL